MLLDITEKISDISLWALDETGKRLESDNYYSWGPKGQPKQIERNGVKQGLNIIGATEILHHFQFLYDEYEKGTEDNTNITSKEVIHFLKRLLVYDADRGVRKTLIILDNALFHRSKEVRQFAKENKDKIVLIFQPKYSPQLNPQENMWNWLKKYLSSVIAFKSIPELSDKIKEFDLYIRGNLDLVKQRVWARNYYK